jgi:hypothetical protein
MVRQAWRLLRDQGLRKFLSRAFKKVGAMIGGEDRPMLVAEGDAAAVDWTIPPETLRHPVVVTSGPLEMAWISSPPGAESGGHQNLFRFIRFAEDAGHRATIYLYDQTGHSMNAVRNMLASSSAYPDLRAKIVRYDPEVGVAPETQALFATGWETAYPAFRDASRARRFYFVQDFEPLFYPVGSEYVLAENTYRFGFHGITAGGWLSHKLRAEYDMPADHFDFAVDRSRYHVTNTAPRTEIFFYARPVTPRRAFELGMIALADFAAIRPDVTINLAGWDVSDWKVPFPHRNLASLDISQLNDVYNRCAAGLVLSLSNMSLLPLELMASGVAPIVNDAPNNRLVSNNPYIDWVEASPPAIARKLVDVIERPDAAERAVAMSASLDSLDWSHSGTQFLTAVERVMRG